MGPEKKIEDRVTRQAIMMGYLPIKFTPKGDVGWPDHIFIKDGKHIWIEFKAYGKVPSTAQNYRMEQLAKHGAKAYWCDNVERGIQILEENA